MSRDPDGEPDAQRPPDRDPEATQAYVPTFDEREPIAPLIAEETGPDWSAESLLPLAVVDPGSPEPAPARSAEAAEPSGLELLFGDGRLEEPASTAVALRRDPGAPAEPQPPREPDPERAAQNQRSLLLAAGALLGVLVLVALFALGTRLPALLDLEPDIAVTAAPLPVPTGPLGPVEPGVWAWDELRGGECLEPYTDAWAAEFTVVPCDEPHSAQLVVRGSYAEALVLEPEEEPVAPAFPGADALAAGIDALCAAAGTLDYAAAQSVSDGQMQGSFPTTAEQWDDDPAYSCFFSRSSGGSLTGSVAP